MSVSASSCPSLAGLARASLRPSTRNIHPRPRYFSPHPATSPFSTSSAACSQESASAGNRQIPRWQQTPPAMAMPIKLRPTPESGVYEVNKSPELLDSVYRKMLGKDGDQLLPEELKWLAVTHKSFDHARRGYNDRLAYLGKRIVDLQCSLALLNAPQTRTQSGTHVALKGLDNLTSMAKTETLHRDRLSQIAQSYGLDRVVQWTPRRADNLKTSGVDVVLTHTLYSIVGAVALHRGGEEANRVAKEKILRPLGL